MAELFRTTRWLIAAILVTLAVTACQNNGQAFGPGAGLNGFGGSVRPRWIDRYPNDPAYYIGVGSSKTGNRADDMDAARAKALVNLAASIATQIQSDLLVTAREDTKGANYSAVEQTIRESVDQNIREVEVADSYYSEDEGYWFYLRLNRAVWEAILREEMDTLERRVTALVAPELGDPSVPIASRLAALWKGWSLLAESPYAGLIESTLVGETGVLIDVVERYITRYVDSLSIRIEPDPIRSILGAPAPVRASVVSNMRHLPGVVTLALRSAETPAKVFAMITTGADGTYSGELTFADLEPGNFRLIASIDSVNVPQGIKVPEQDLLLEISMIRANLDVTTEDVEVSNIRASFESLLSSKLPVKFSTNGDTGYEVGVEVSFRTSPANEYGIIVAFSKAFIAVRRGGDLVRSYNSPEFKDGGLTLEQAYTRAFDKLIEGLEESAEMSEELRKAFLLE